MARRSPLLLLLLLPALALGVLVWLDQRPRAPESAAGMVAAHVDLETSVAELAEAAPIPEDASDDTASLDGAATSTDRRVEVATRIEGRITYNNGATPGGSVLVLAGPNKTSWQWERAARRIWAGLSTDAVVHGFADSRGHFALDWTGKDTQLAVVALAPTAATNTPVLWRAMEDAPLSLTLAPRAALFVDVRTGAGFGAGTAPDFRGAELRLRMPPTAKVDDDAARIPAARRNMNAWVDENGRAAILAVSVDADFELSYVENEAVPTTQPVPFLANGEQRTVVLELTAGATILGRVLDESGSPVASAKVHVHRTLAPGLGGHPRPSTETNNEGRFTLTHVERSATKLGLSKTGFVEGAHELVPGLADGTTKDLGDLVLDHGARFAGHVRYPDGSPAVGAKVSATLNLSNLEALSASFTYTANNANATADEEGHFAFSGLPKGPAFDLVAEKPSEAFRSIAHLTAVRDGQRDLVLVLDTAPTIVGRVLAPNGEPVAGALVHAVPKSDSEYITLGDWSGGTARTSPNGNFRLQLDKPATVAIEARAKGFAPSSTLLVDAPNDVPLELHLRPALSVMGRVVDATGTPVRGATVERVEDSDDPMDFAAHSGSSRALRTRSNSSGNFKIDDQPAGAFALRARHDEYAPSAEVMVELEHGISTPEVLLTLRRGAVVRGVVYREGAPVGGQTEVWASALSSSEYQSASTNDIGEFVFENLTPGHWQFSSVTYSHEPQAGGRGGVVTMVENEARKRLVLEDGKEYLLELGAPPRNPVVVHGVVRQAGKPVAGSRVRFVAGDGFQSGESTTTADHAGRYEVVLPAPGSYSVMAGATSEGSIGSFVELRREIPLVARHGLDIELPVGAIRGQVRGPDGRPMRDVLVRGSRDDGHGLGSLSGGGGYALVATDQEGRYELALLGPGSYRVTAGGSFIREAAIGAPPAARAQRTGIVLGADEVREGVDFALGRAGEVRGQVRDRAGNPIPSATIFARDAAGVPLRDDVPSDSSGAFLWAELAPGSYTFEARRGGLASAESATVTVRADGSSQIDLVVSQGAFLVLQVEGANHTNLAEGLVRIDVHDARNRPIVGLVDSDDSFGGSSVGNEHRVGPLPPGSYRAFATGPGGERIDAAVVLAAGDERRVVLTLPD